MPILASILTDSTFIFLCSGLGDYHLEPEYIFFADLFIWAFVFLIGFTFLSTFLNQMSDLCNGIFPDGGEALKERLRNTNLVGIGAVHYKEKNETALQNIGQIVEKMDDDSVSEMMQRVTRIRQKKELLIHLLYQTQEELDYFTKRGETYEEPPISRVAEEENMLSEVLEDTSRERAKLERYRNKVVVEDEEVPVVTTCEEKAKNGGNTVNQTGRLPFLTSIIFFLSALSLTSAASSSSPPEFPGALPANHVGPSSPQNNLSISSGQTERGDTDSEDESSSDWDDTLMDSYNDNPTLGFAPSSPSAPVQKSRQDSPPNSKSPQVSSRSSKNSTPKSNNNSAQTFAGNEHVSGQKPQMPTSKPLKTLEKLQQLLDETDYMTTSSSAMASYQDESGSDEEPVVAASSTESPSQPIGSLWTSQDRSKYKKQQLFQEQLQRHQQSQQQISDNEDNSDTDDGLGYTLPKLPVYLSDDEGDSTGPSHNPLQALPPQYPPPTSQQQQQNAANLAHQHFLQQQRELYLAQQLFHNQQQQQQTHPAYNPNVPYYPPPNAPYFQHHSPQYPSPNMHLPQQQAPPPGFYPQGSYPPSSADSFPRPHAAVSQSTAVSMYPRSASNGAWQERLPFQASVDVSAPFPPSATFQLQQPEYLQHFHTVPPQLPLALRVLKSFISVQRLAVCSGIIALLCYSAVSPRTLHFIEYNRHFYENLRRAALVVIPPLIVYSWGVVNWTGDVGKATVGDETTRHPFSDSNPIHSLIRAMSRSFTLGYIWIFFLEIALTTLLRLSVFAWWEPEMFAMPKPPLADAFPVVDESNGGVLGGLSGQAPPPAWLILPWVLREHRFRVKRITLLVADFVTSCVMSPIVEEYFKLRLLQWNIRLSK